MISKDEVKKVAQLARLGLGEEEIGKFQKELSKIFDYIEKLKKVDVSNIEPTSHPNKAENIIRKDKNTECSKETKEQIVNNFPESEDGYIKVKQVL